MTTDVRTEELRLPMPWGHVAAKAWGSPNDKHVLVVHGILDNAGSFDRLIPLLTRGYYFVCIDLPGHGLSSSFPAGIALDHFHYVSVIRKVLDCLEWKNYCYMGHSFGALLGLVHSALYPRGIEKLIFFDLDSAIPVTNDELIGYIRYIQDYTVEIGENENIPRLYSKTEVMRTLMHYRNSALNIEAAEALVKRSVTKVGDRYKFNRDPRLNIGAFGILNNEQHMAILKAVKAPISVIRSSELALVSNDSPQSAKIDPDNEKNQFVTVEGNHDVHNNYPERVAPHVCRFLENLKSTL